MPSLRQSFQPKFKFNHPFSQAHRIQTLQLRIVPQSFPAKGRPQEAQRDAAHRIEADGQLKKIFLINVYKYVID